MDKDKKIELIIKVLGPVLTMATVVVGIWQFNSGQSSLKEREIAQRNFELSRMNNEATLEALAKFKELQTKLYVETSSVIGYLIVNKNVKTPQYQEKLDRFWQLYWVELSAVETREVEQAMFNFGQILQEIQDSDFRNFPENQYALKAAGYKVAQAIKRSASTWELPEGLAK